MRKLLLAVMLALFAAFGWGWYSPYYTLGKLRDAAQAGDAEYVNAHIDYPAVRESLQASMKAVVTRKLGGEAAVQHNPFARFGAAIAGAVSVPLTEGLVTPEGMRELLRHTAHRSGGERTEDESDKSAEVGSGTEGAAPSGDGERPFHNAGAGYRSWREFSVQADSRIGPLALVFKRQGLFGWKLKALEVSGN
ncbi:DUF2939 domain-containing protein [Crenobacter sp. SG2303]|uniref:DUF2939 domain-containing protein n=1 Tax=Crenobacter oryzisoli TaxID=3056844 RepID=A0ABT7XM09_9NEIS|nr:DUF2939 domain-containing protein [Crenobacter sp. SG2303]MDN0074817.1 DUF2939 domain-containing protein [Crenobacter sp. SG2303]